MDDVRLVVDFHEDWVALLRANLVADGYRLRVDASPEDVAFAHFNVLKRAIDPKPRKVLQAAEFSFPVAHAVAVEAIRLGSERGDNLNPHMSRALLDAEYNDALLNAWGIHHFHLGILAGPDGFVERTGPLLFARVAPDALHFIDVMSHGAWNKRRILEVLHRNWPETLEPYRARGVVGIAQVSESDAAGLRRVGVNVLVELGGVAYVPPGGGLMPSGIAMDVVMQADRYRRWIRAMSQHVLDNADYFIEQLRARGAVISGDVRLRLRLDADHGYAFHEESGISFRVGSWREEASPIS